MTDQNDRTETARRTDDHDLIDRAAEGAGEAHVAGGRLATDLGTRDELREEIDGETGSTRVTGQDKVQPNIPTRADNEGANG